MELAPFLFGCVALVAANISSVRQRKKREASAKVTQLHIYPVKSCKGIAVDNWPITDTGLLYDRCFMIVDAETNKFVTQRQKPKLALIETAISPLGTLTLSAPDMESPITIDGAEVLSGPIRKVEIWEELHDAHDAGDATADWLSRYIGSPCRLVRMNPDYCRGLSEYWVRSVPRDPAPPLRTGFADGFPFLLISEKTRQWLQAQVNSNSTSTTDQSGSNANPNTIEIRMNRFRPNIVVDGDLLQPLEDDMWRTIKIGETEFHSVKPCSRCVMTTVEQETAKLGTEPLKTLNRVRASYLANRAGKSSKAFLFGHNLVHQRSGGVLKIGDSLTVLSYQDPPTFITE